MKNYQIYFLVDVDVAELHVLNSHRTETQQTTKKRGEKRLQRCQFVQKTKDRKHVSMRQIQIFNKIHLPFGSPTRNILEIVPDCTTSYQAA